MEQREQLNMREQVKAFTEGKYRENTRDVQIDAGWYDWFCRDISLGAKTAKLYIKVQQIMGSMKFDPLKTYVFFKNNCPMNGQLYDDFRICDLETGDVLFTVVPACGHDSTRQAIRNGERKGPGEVWGWDESGEFRELMTGTWADIKKFFLS